MTQINHTRADLQPFMPPDHALLTRRTFGFALVTAATDRVLTPLWTGDMGANSGHRIQRMDADRWHIPDFQETGRYPDHRHRGGRIFNGRTLRQHWLPLKPSVPEALTVYKFLATAPDETTAAWLALPGFNQNGNEGGVLLVGDGREPQHPAIVLSAKAVARNSFDPPPPGETPWQTWFDGAARWQRHSDGRWGLVLQDHSPG